MYTFVSNLRFRDALLAEGPAFLLSWGFAEVFYKFHSFTLECGAFLGTWLAISVVLSALTRPWRAARKSEA